MKVLVVGGAGYIGAHTARMLQQSGHEPVLFDSLLTGHAEAARRLELPLVEGDLNHPTEIHAALSDHSIDAVMHFAANALVGESVTNPSKYYQNNVVGSLNLLDAMRSHGVHYMIFSSTCATYGLPLKERLDEGHPQQPINPYGWSKLMVEQILRDYSQAYDMGFVALRYFNAAGASPDALIGEDHTPETHLIPLCLMTAAARRDNLTIFGTDYETLDGTCIRDYIHVDDLATAHVAGLDYLAANGPSVALNVGTGRGHSVREVIRCCEEVTDLEIPVVEGQRREGDPPVLVAAADKIREVLDWNPQYTELRDVVETAWRWFQNGGRY